MDNKLMFYGVRMLFFLLLIIIPIYSYALDTRGGEITALDAQTFVVTKEFAGEIRLYLCGVEEGRIFIKDSSSIPYMTMEQRDMSKSVDDKLPPGSNESPIIKTVP